MKRTCITLCAVVALIVAGCASDDDDSTAVPSTSSTATTMAPTTTSPPTTTTAAPAVTTTTTAPQDADPQDDSFLDVAAGTRHSCALFASGGIWCWGENINGQLGNGEAGSNSYSTVPVPVQGITDAVAITAGFEHTCAVHATGEISCWGDDTNGELGDGEFRDFSSVPVKVVNMSDAVDVSAGQWHTCALREGGKVSCWGSDHDGQLGNGQIGDEFDSAVPVEVMSVSDAVAVAAGGEHTCAVHATGEISCWGDNWRGELGTGEAGNEFDSGVPLKVLDIDDAVDVASGDWHTCALREGGNISCWGTNSNGELGSGQGNELSFSSTPLDVLGLSDAVEVSAGAGFSCAVSESGNVSCWGQNVQGQLGMPPPDLFSSRPVTLKDFDEVTTVATGSGHACALKESGGVFCWGSNFQGQLGNGEDIGVSYERVQVSGIDDAIDVSSGFRHACSTHESGEVSCWGTEWRGQAGEMATTNTPPLPVKLAGITNATGVSSNVGVNCAASENGEASCWGFYLFNTITTTDSGDISPEPIKWGAPSDIVRIATGGYHACSLHEDGTINCAGANWYGNLGNGEYGTSTRISWIPRPVVNIDDAVDITLGFAHTCAVHATGEVSCWGRNDHGQLGNGTAGSDADSATPVKVIGITDAVSVSASHGSLTCVVHATGEVSCWGSNYLGELGSQNISGSLHSSTDHSAEPVKVDGITDAASVSAGLTHACVVHESGEVSCWGHNAFGELGTAGQIPDDQTPTPIRLEDLADVRAVSTGPVHTCVAHTDGNVTCWGWNEGGQLGNGQPFENTGSHEPSRVLGT